MKIDQQQLAAIAPGIEPRENTVVDVDLVFNYAYTLKEKFAVSDEHFALAIFQVTITAIKERLFPEQRQKVSLILFNSVKAANVAEDASGLKLAFVPSVVELIAEDLLDYLHCAGYPQKSGFLALIALVKVSLENIQINPDDYDQLVNLIVRNLPVVLE